MYRTPGWARVGRLALIVPVGVLIALAAQNASASILDISASPAWIGLDVHQYLGFTRAWMSGSGWYAQTQLDGPYVIETLAANVYPPTALYLLVPFALGLPLVLWWAIPMTVIVLAYRALHVGWRVSAAAILAVAAMDRTWTVVVLGNPAMWSIAAAVAGVAWNWPAVGALTKTTFAPLALIGIRRRSWWVAACVALLLAIPFGSMWMDYWTVLANAQTSRGAMYVVGEWPIAIVMVGVAAATRMRRACSSRSLLGR